MADYQDIQGYNDYSEQPARNNRTWLIVAIVVVLVVLCCCCLAVVAAIALFSQELTAGLDDLVGVVPALRAMLASA